MKRLLAFLLSLVMLMSFPLVANASDMPKGFDVSAHNGEVDFATQSSSNGFVMIRLGNFTYLDVKFWDNVKGACDAGLDFGVYMYSAAFDNDEARIEGQFVIDTLAQMPEEYKAHFKLPVAYDIEAKGLMDFSPSLLTSNVVTFSQMMIDAGYVPMVYANTDWFTNRLDINTFKDKGYKIWLADWVPKPDFNKKHQVGNTGVYADMWQYSDNGENGFDADIILSDDIYNNYRNTTASLKKSSLTYNGKVQKPAVIVKDSAGNTVSSKYYDVTYSKGCKAVGKYTAKIKLKGKYKGSFSKSFTINPSNTSLKLSPIKQGFKASWKKTAYSYEIRYSLSKDMKNAKSVKIKDTKAVSKTISKLKSKKTYYVQIRTYKTVNSKPYYSSWSAKKTVKTK